MAWEFKKYETLEEAVRRFFEILDIKEESGMSGHEFHPNKMDFKDRKISSIRVYNSEELKSVFEQMKELSKYNEINTYANT